MSRWQLSTIAAHAAGSHNRGTGGVVGAIETSTTFLRDEAYRLPESGDIYRRDHNATVREAEGVIAALEGAAEARLFASGLAAIAAVMRAAAGPIALQEATYYGTARLGQLYEGDGRRIVRFDGTQLETLEAAMEAGPGLVLIETPSNPWLGVVDIARAADIAHAGGAVLAVDSTAATPMVTRPLAFGADIVIHSATKALNGHSDVLAGVLAVADAALPVWEKAKMLRAMEGAVLGGFDAYLLTRGMKTLGLRAAAMNASAQTIAEWLEGHPKVATVRYPGLLSHPGHQTALKQMTGGFGGLLSFDVKGGAEEALAVLSRLALVKRATSLGGVETLIEHRHSIEPAFTGMPPALLRLSVGIEAVEDIIADLDAGLAAIP